MIIRLEELHIPNLKNKHMKKTVLTLVAVVMTMGLMAQFPHLGFRAGVTNNKLSTNAENILSSENRVGYHVGAFIRINLGKMYLQPEVLYNHRSTKLNVIQQDISLEGVSSIFKLGGIDVPVLIGVKLLNYKAFNIRVFAGPNVSFTNNKDIVTDHKGEPKTIVSPEDFENTTWYAQAGMGIDIFNFTFDVRYEKGISNMHSGKWVGLEPSSIDLKNNVWVFTLGFKLI